MPGRVDTVEVPKAQVGVEFCFGDAAHYAYDLAAITTDTCGAVAIHANIWVWPRHTSFFSVYHIS